MMATQEIKTGFKTAFRLFTFDRTAAAGFDDSVDGTRRSFQACFLSLIFIILLMGVRDTGNSPVSPNLVYTVHSLTYTITICSFALLMWGLSHGFDRAHRYRSFLCAFNWGGLVPLILLAPIVILSSFGVLSAELTVGLNIVVWMISLIYAAWIVHVTLELGWELSGFVAVAHLVVTDTSGAIGVHVLQGFV